MSDTRILEALSDFDTYIKTVIAFLQGSSGTSTNGERLGLTTTEIAAAADFLTKWFTGDADNPGAYELHTNPATKGKTSRLAVLRIMAGFRKLFNPFLNRMSGSANITPNDRLIFKIAPPVTTYHKNKTQIKDEIYALIKATGSGNINIMCRTEHEASRGSLPDDSDGVEVVWSLGTPPETAHNAQFKLYFSKSKFTINAGLDNSGKKIYLYVRWINSKHPEIAGNWSMQYSSLIV
jgi:hypothetical protein